MKSRLITWLLAGMVLVSGTGVRGELSGDIVETLQNLPLTFTPNVGQWDSQVLFQADAGPVTIWITRTGITYQMTRRSVAATSGSPRGGQYEQLLLRVTLPGAREEFVAVGEESIERHTNFLIGNDPRGWWTDLPGYRAVCLSQVYPGIDLRFYGRGDGLLEYDFIVAPGADPGLIRINYDGAESMTVNEAGELVIGTPWNRVIEKCPQIFQASSDGRSSVTGAYRLVDRFCFGFEIGDYDPTRPLVIDPTLAYSTYLGGGGSDIIEDMVVDATSSVYVTGYTSSRNFPLQTPYQTTFAGIDAFVSKLSFAGDALVFSTYLGGMWDDYGRGIAVGSNGRIYVTGETESSNFPIMNAADPTLAGEKFDAFVTVLNASGNSLVFSTFLGGAMDDYGRDIAVSPAGTVYVTGETKSTDFPTLNPFQAALASSNKPDAFVTMYSATGVVSGSTYLGGAGDDYGQAIAWADTGGVGIAGKTNSANFPLQNPLQSTLQGATDIFFARFNAAGNGLVYSSYLGGSANELLGGLVFGSGGAATLTGSTESADFPIVAELQTDQTGWDAFISRVTPDGSALQFSTYLGGVSADYGQAVALDAATGTIYLTGETFSNNFPTVDPYQSGLNGTSDVFVAGISADGSTLNLSSYLGGSTGLDYGTSVGFSGSLFVAGYTYSTDFPMQAAFQDSHRGGNTDGYIARMILHPICADINGNGSGPDIADLVYMVAFMFQGGPEPPLPAACDINGDGSIADIADLVDLVTYMFQGGSAPSCW
ncbi:MAG TPA: SBBP repeat-containing protein [candidate division Zixibacteria bacterium]|nr:SBBP repeat-containing protein [candidate division Zixibacteria bacterium]